jgi:hypothetical protein
MRRRDSRHRCALTCSYLAKPYLEHNPSKLLDTGHPVRLAEPVRARRIHAAIGITSVTERFRIGRQPPRPWAVMNDGRGVCDDAPSSITASLDPPAGSRQSERVS